LIGWTLVRVTSIGLTLVVTLIVSSRSSRINLRLRVRKRQHQHCQQRQVFHVAHISPLGSRAPTSISTGSISTGHLLWSGFGLPITANHEPEPLLIGTRDPQKSCRNRCGSFQPSWLNSTTYGPRCSREGSG
jgi:hypothetical protein